MSVSSCRLWRGRGGSNEKGAALAVDAQGETLIGGYVVRARLLKFDTGRTIFGTGSIIFGTGTTI